MPADEITEQDGSSPIIKSVEVAVQILDILMNSGGKVRVTELSRELGVTKTRISRHLQTLTHLGMVDRASEGEGYVFGRKLMKLGHAASYHNSVVEIAKPHLSALHQKTGHTIFMATPTQGGALIVAAFQNALEPGIMVQPGMVLRLPHSPSARILNQISTSPPSSVLHQNLQKYGLDFEKDPSGTGLGGIAAPIIDGDGDVAAAVGVILSSALFDQGDPLALFEPVLKTAQDIQAKYAKGSTLRVS